MRFFTFFFILLTSVVFSEAQEIPGWKIYAGLVNQAELSIIDADYSKAVEYYRQAFGAVPFRFSRDLYNAICCTRFSGDEKLAFDLCRQLAQKGCDTAFFASSVFDFLRERQSWEAFRLEIPVLHAAFLEGTNLALKSEISAMLESDQYYRKLEKNQAKGSPEQLIYKDSIQLTDSLRYLRLLEIFQQYGYPGESTTGVTLTADGTLLQKHELSVVLLHLFQKGRLDLAPYLLRGVENGSLKPEEYANYHEFVYNLKKDSSAFYLRNPVMQIDEDYYKVAHADHPEIMELFNRNRARIGMASVQDEQKKIIFQLKHRDSEFLLQPYLSLARISPPAGQKEQMLTSFEKIE